MKVLNEMVRWVNSAMSWWTSLWLLVPFVFQKKDPQPAQRQRSIAMALRRLGDLCVSIGGAFENLRSISRRPEHRSMTHPQTKMAGPVLRAELVIPIVYLVFTVWF